MRSVVVGCLLAVGLSACVGGNRVDDAKVQALIRDLDSDSTRTRELAAQRLGQMGPAAAAAAPALVRQLGTGHRNQMLVVDATNALLRIGPRAAIPPAVEAVKSGDPEIGYGAAFLLGGF